MELTPDNVACVCQKYAAMQHPVEVYCLLRFLRGQNVRLVVELGVHRGGMAAALLTFLPGSRLVGVEMLPVGSPHPAIESVPLGEDAPTLAGTMGELGFAVVEGNSHDQSSLDRALAMFGAPREGRCIDFVFIDASHDYDSVRWDFELWGPHARLVGFHDLYSDDIQRYWQEITPHGTFGVWKEPDGLGIGLMCL